MPGGRSRVVAQRPLIESQLASGIGLVKGGVQALEHGQSLPVAGDGGAIVPGQLLHLAQVGDRDGLGEPVARLARQRQRLLTTTPAPSAMPPALWNGSP